MVDYFSVGDHEMLSEIIFELLKDDEQRKKLSENAKEISGRFHPHNIFALWDQVLVKSVVEK